MRIRNNALKTIAALMLVTVVGFFAWTLNAEIYEQPKPIAEDHSPDKLKNNTVQEFQKELEKTEDINKQASSEKEVTKTNQKYEYEEKYFSAFKNRFGQERIFQFENIGSQTNKILHYIPDNLDISQIYIISHDFNDDGLKDVLFKIKSAAFCEEFKCQTYLLLNRQNDGYQRLVGPKIVGLEVIVSNNKTDSIRDLLFDGNTAAFCIWKWAHGVDQDYACSAWPSR